MVRIPKRTQDKAWLAFTDWCLSKGLSPVPAHPWTLAAYALALEDHLKPQDIRKTLNAVAKAHLLKSRSRPDRHPMIERTLKMIENRRQTRESKSELFDESLVAPKEAKGESGANARPLNKKPEAGETTKAAKKVRVLSTTPRLVRRRKSGH